MKAIKMFFLVIALSQLMACSLSLRSKLAMVHRNCPDGLANQDSINTVRQYLTATKTLHKKLASCQHSKCEVAYAHSQRAMIKLEIIKNHVWQLEFNAQCASTSGKMPSRRKIKYALYKAKQLIIPLVFWDRYFKTKLFSPSMFMVTNDDLE